MKLTKKTLSILISLAIVFTTLVCMSVSANIDLRVPDSPVVYSGGKASNCKSATPTYLSGGKIIACDVENLNDTDSASMQRVTITGLTELYNAAKSQNKNICIDFYSEFKSKNDKTNANIRLDFGGGLVKSAASSNVASPSESSIANFVNGKIETIKFKASDLTPYNNAATDLVSYLMKITALTGDTLTGSFWATVPYLEGSISTGTVPVTSYKTTTTKATGSNTDNTIDVFETDAVFTSVNQAAYSNSKVMLGDVGGTYQGKYFYCFNNDTETGNRNQVQAQVKMSGFKDLYDKAVAAGKDLCMDVYVNPEFNNGGDGTSHKVDFKALFNNNNNKWVGGDNENDKTVLSNGMRKTIVITTSMVTGDATQIDFQFNNYSYYPYYIKNATFIITTPYMEGANVVSQYKESTTSTTTTTAASTANYDGKSDIGIYDNGIAYTSASGSRGVASLGYDTNYGNKYFYVYGNAEYSWGGSQITGTVKFDNAAFAALVNKAKEQNKAICMDIYANNFSDGGTSTVSNCYFRVQYNGCSQTGEKDRKITSSKRQTIVLSSLEANNIVKDTCTSFNYQFLNWSFGGNRIYNPQFIVSVPYLEGDQPSVKINIDQPTTKSPVYTPETDSLPITAPDSKVEYKNLWANSGVTAGSIGNNKILWGFAANQTLQVNLGSKEMTNFADLYKRAKELNTKIKFDVYSEYLCSGSAYANFRVSFGKNSFYQKDDKNKDFQVKSNTLYTFEYTPEQIIESLTPTPEKIEAGVYQVEKISRTGDGTVASYTQTDIEPKNSVMQQFSGLTAGKYVEYTISGLDAGEYNVNLSSRDIAGRGICKVFLNDVECDKTVDFNTAKDLAYVEHQLGKANADENGNIKVKLVCETAPTGSYCMILDKFTLTRTDGVELTTPATTTLSEDDILKNASNFNICFQRNENYNSWNAYGRFYASVPYIDDPEVTTSRVPVSGVTTTTTRATATNKTDSMPSGGWDASKITWPTDTSLKLDWAGNSSEGVSTATIGTGGKYAEVKLQDVGAKRQCQVQVKLIGMDWLIEQAKVSNGSIAFDVYPQFGSTTKCYMTYNWGGGKSSGDYDHEFTTNKPYTIRTYLDELPSETPGTLHVTLQNYSFGNLKFDNCRFLISAPYLYEPEHPEKTEVKTVLTTTQKTTTTTQVYPSTNSGTTKFSIGTAEVTPFGTARVPISISGNAGLYNASFSVKYDYDNLNYRTYSAGNVFKRVASGGDQNGVINFLMESDNDTKANGVVLWLEFETSDTLGSYLVVFGGGNGYEESNYFNMNGEDVPCSFVTGGVVVTNNPKTTTTSSNTKVGRVNLKSVTLGSDTSAKIKWTATSGAKYYEIYRRTNGGKFVKIKDKLITTAYTNKGLKASTNYTYYVRGVNGSKAGANSVYKTITPMNRKAKATIKSLSKSKKSTTVKISKKIVGATGYQIQYSTNSKFKKAKATTSTKLTKSINKLKAKTKYYVRIRPYNTVNGKRVYSKSWSKVKTVKVK